MTEKIAYYPGCTAKSYAKYMDSTSRDVMKEFGIDLVELTRWTCCGTFYGLADDNLYSQLAPIRNMIRTREDGFTDLVTTCSMCYNTLKRANLLFKTDEEKAERLNAFMYEEKNYEEDVNVWHLLEIIRDKVDIEKITRKVVNPLKGLKVAPYYGCTLVRPEEISIDSNPEKPTILTDLIFALGAEPVEDPYMTECCGSYLTVKDKHLVADRTNKIIGSMTRRGAEIIMVSCPLCQFNLDRRQKQARELNPSLPEIPVVYFTQLMALALGMDYDKLGFKEHHVDPTIVLKKRKLLGTPEKVPIKVKK
ncbi:MAG TPA: CoB--CoM heterodisulfide reductase iron-sulfur subunit B family protein [candidate division Zixibacteria bacterium]|nr:CoB--CoM heterodisulfide reductase iron-sulfur subunit B family protein [candidate division Zixibacteria bacterium]